MKDAAYLPVFFLFVEEHVANDLELGELISRDLADQDQVDEGLTRSSIFIALKSPSASPIVRVIQTIETDIPARPEIEYGINLCIFFIGPHIPYDNSLWAIQKRTRKTDLARSQSVDHVFPSSRVC